MADVASPFVAAGTVGRYHLGRPYHHQRTLERVLEVVSVRRGVAVDVAAGTGLSMRALAALGFEAVGVEPVPAMLALARHATGLPFVLGTGEALPIAGHVASLVTVCSAVHWFDQQRFFTEARRVLGEDGVLVLYEHAAVHLPDDERFSEWLRTDYVARYPTPPRGTVAGTTGEPDGLRRCFSDTWIDTVVFRHDGLVDYLMTQSNVVDAIESGREPENAVRSWLATATAQYFSTSEEQAFGFHVLAEALGATERSRFWGVSWRAGDGRTGGAVGVHVAAALADVDRPWAVAGAPPRRRPGPGARGPACASGYRRAHRCGEDDPGL